MRSVGLLTTCLHAKRRKGLYGEISRGVYACYCSLPRSRRHHPAHKDRLYCTFWRYSVCFFFGEDYIPDYIQSASTSED